MRADDKLRNVLDYVSCEACLATPSPEQELLCGLCKRLDRTIAVKAVVRTQVILERPEPATAAVPVEISPATSAAAATVPTTEPEHVPAEGESPSEDDAAASNGAPGRFDRLAGLLRRARPASSEDAPVLAPAAEEAPAEPTVEEDAPLPVEVVTKRRALFPLRRSSPAIEVVVEPIEEENEPEAAPVTVPVQTPAEAEPEPAESASLETVPLESEVAPEVEPVVESESEPAPVEQSEPPVEPDARPPAAAEFAAESLRVEDEPAPAEPEADPAAAEQPQKSRRFLGFFRRKDAPSQESAEASEPESPAEAAAPAAEEEDEWDDLVSYDAPSAASVVEDEEAEDDDVFSYTPGPDAEPAPEPATAASVPADPLVSADEDDADTWMEADEVPLEPPVETPVETTVDDDPLAWAPPTDDDATQWAPPAADEPASEPEALAAEEVEEEVFEMEVLDDDEDEAPAAAEAAESAWSRPAAAPPEEVEDEEIVEMELLDDEEEPAEAEPLAEAQPAEGEELEVSTTAPAVETEPAPAETEPPVEPPAEPPTAPTEEPAPPTATAETPTETPQLTPETDDSDLWRLDHITPTQRTALHQAGINQLAHLHGIDPTPLAEQTGIPRDTLRKWQHTADFVTQAGIPIDGARAMVNAGIEGPGALAALDVDTVIEQVELSGGGITAREVKRWKRRV